MRPLVVLLFASCAPTVAVLVKSPGTSSGDPYAPVNEAETGIVSFRSRQMGEGVFLDGRAAGQQLMYATCDGPYRIESEDTDSSRLGSWRVARFTCVNGPPVSLNEKIAQRLHVATGCPREYVVPVSTGPDSIRYLVCNVHYACSTGGDAGVECALAR